MQRVSLHTTRAVWLSHHLCKLIFAREGALIQSVNASCMLHQLRKACIPIEPVHATDVSSPREHTQVYEGQCGGRDAVVRGRCDQRLCRSQLGRMGVPLVASSRLWRRVEDRGRVQILLLRRPSVRGVPLQQHSARLVWQSRVHSNMSRGRVARRMLQVVHSYSIVAWDVEDQSPRSRTDAPVGWASRQSVQRQRVAHSHAASRLPDRAKSNCRWGLLTQLPTKRCRVVPKAIFSRRRLVREQGGVGRV